MAETVRDLTVRLAFEHGDTKSQIAAIKNEIKLLETDFAAAAASAGGFSAGLDETAARSRMLQQQIALQEQAVQKYNTAIQAQQEKISAAQQRQQQYSEKISQAREKQQSLSSEMDRVKAAMEQQAAATGKGSAEYQALAEELDNLQSEYDQTETAIRGWERGINNANTQIGRADREIQRLTIAQNESRAAIGRMQQSLDQQNSRLEQNRARLQAAAQAMQDYGEKAKQAGEWQEAVGSAMNKATAAIVGAGVASAGAAIQWESSCADVEKTVSGTAEQLAQIESSLLEMSQTKPVDNTVLADIAANAGQLGIWTDNVVEFTGVMSDLSATTNLTAEEGASAFAKFANITGMAQTEFGRMGSTVVELGNNMATTESDIVNMATGLASAGHQVGMTEAEILGVAAGLSSLGLEAQAGGTAFSKLLVNMQVAVETGSEDLKKYAEVAGMTAEQFKVAFGTNAAEAVTTFIQGLSTGSKSAIAILDEMGVSETRFRDMLLRTANASSLFTGAIKMANQAWSENTALANEAAVRYNTTSSKMTMLGNQAKAAAINFGNELKPLVSDGVEWASEMLEKFNALDSAQRKQIMTWAAYVAAIGPTFTLIGKANTGIGNLSTKMGKLTAAAAQAGGGFGGFAASVKSLLGPAGIAALAVAAGVMIYKFADWVSGAKAAREAQEALNEAVEKWNEDVQTAYERSEGMQAFGLSAQDFSVNSSADGAQWLQTTIDTWTDGQKETQEIVVQTVQSFTNGTAQIRSSLEGLRDTAGGGTIGDLDRDLETLDAIDTEIESILKKKQNGYLSDDDLARMQELVDQREAIQVKYNLVDGTEGAFGGIVQGVEAALARGADGAATFSDAFAAATQGMGAFTDSLNAEYDARYRVISAMEDGAAKNRELAALNQWYNEESLAAQNQYYEAVTKSAEMTGVFAEGGQFSETTAQLEHINELMAVAAGKDSASAEMIALREALAGLDEGGIVEMEAAIMAVEEAAIATGQAVPEGLLAAKTALEEVKAAALDSSNVFSEDVAESINTMFAGLSTEVPEVFATLNCDGLSTSYDAWAAGEHAPIIPSLDDATLSNIDLTGNITNLAAAEGASLSVDVDGNITDVEWPEGSSFTTDVKGNITGVTTPAGTTYAIDAEGKIRSATTADGVTLEVDGEGKVTALKIAEGVTFEVDVNGNITTATPADGVRFTVDGDGRVTNAAPNADVRFEVDGDGRVNNIIVQDGLTYTVDGDGRVTSVSTAEGVRYEVKGDGTITAVALAPDVTLPTVELQATATVEAINFDQGQYSTSGRPDLEYQAGMNRQNENAFGLVDFDAPQMTEKLHNLATAVDGYNAAIDSSNANAAQGWADSISYIGQTLGSDLGYNGGMGFEAMAQSITNGMQLLSTGQFTDEGAAEFSGYINDIITVLSSSTGEAAAAATSFGTTMQDGLSDALNAQGWTTTGETVLSEISTAFSTASGQAKQIGEDIGAGIGEGQAAHDFSGAAEETIAADEEALRSSAQSHSPAARFEPLGEDISAGIGNGMAMHDFAAEAEIVISSIEAAFGADAVARIGEAVATGFGAYIATADMSGAASQASANISGALSASVASAGYAEIGGAAMESLATGMQTFSFAATCSAVCAGIKGGFNGLPAQGRSIGSQFGAGLAAGLNAKLPGIVAKARAAANQISAAFRAAWQIHSPSRVAQNLTEMFGAGLEKGMDKWPTVSQRMLESDMALAYGYSSRAASEIGSTTNNNNNNSVNLNVEQMNVSDRQDAEALAYEIADLSRRRNMGRGLR